MDKILLVGNGLTSSLIPDYQSGPMMSKIENCMPTLFEKADSLFTPFRKRVESVQYATVAWGYSGDGFCGEAGFGGPVTDLPYNVDLLAHVHAQLQQYKFGDLNSVLKNYFQTFGLIYETQKPRISNVESLLKIIALFHQVGLFSDSDKSDLIIFANNVYFNGGNCGSQSLSQSVRANIHDWLSTYKMIFTTNYDSLLDDILQSDSVKHLHGGFFYKDKLARCSSLVSPSEAYLIWGISGAEKEEGMKSGISFPIHFPLYFPQSIFMTYLSQLQNTDAQCIDVFGYSGENDQHINKAISKNRSIKEIHYFCDPRDVASQTKEFEIKSRFSIEEPQQLILDSWENVWDQLKAPDRIYAVPESIPE